MRALGAAAQVTVAWSSIDTLEVVLGTGFALRVNDLIRLRGERIRDSTETSDYMPQTSTAVNAPANPLQVQAVVTVPAVVGMCETFRVDASQSTGSAGRARSSTRLGFAIRLEL